MTAPATYAVAPTFLGVERRDRDAPICVAGIPFDLGTSNRSGTRFGPAAIRQASRMLVDGAHPHHWVIRGGRSPIGDRPHAQPTTASRATALAARQACSATARHRASGRRSRGRLADRAINTGPGPCRGIGRLTGRWRAAI
jgi:arginase family enzyme